MVTSYDVMISHMTQITSHGFHAYDSFERMIEFMGWIEEREGAQLIGKNQLMDFAP